MISAIITFEFETCFEEGVKERQFLFFILTSLNSSRTVLVFYSTTLHKYPEHNMRIPCIHLVVLT